MRTGTTRFIDHLAAAPYPGETWCCSVRVVPRKALAREVLRNTKVMAAKLYDMLPGEAYLPGGRAAADSATVRTVFVMGPRGSS